jgi:photosystem II stability/assembly factor-like uncharacterized protein
MADHPTLRSTAALLVGMAVTLCPTVPIVAQAQKGTPVRAVFEPVNYSEDIELTSVFFVTPDIGYVTGNKGTLLRTKDGGEHWEAQLGGDPKSDDRPIWSLRFIDETHGWAVQSTGMAAKLFRTTDGERWSEVGTINEHYTDYLFTSPTEGVYAAGTGLFRTTDGGRSWSKTATCGLKVEVKSLSRQMDCYPVGVSFPSPRVGYAVAYLPSIDDTYVIMKSEDGGASWRAFAVPNVGVPERTVFVDERNGFVTTKGAHLYGTTDGGATWEGQVASPGKDIRFADPEVAWSFHDGAMTYTANGGRRWDKRPIAFPTSVNGFSLPRRDRGYVVGDHGMIFRYRIAPASYANAKALDAPVMPAFSSALATDVAQLTEQLAAFEQSLGDSSAGGGSASAGGARPQGRPTARGGKTTPSGAAAGAGATASDPAAQASVADATPFMQSCCGKGLGRLQLLFEATTGLLPDFLQRFRSLNLLVQGLRTANALPTTADSLKTALKEFRTSSDRTAARAALARVSATLAAFKQAADTAMLKQGEGTFSQSAP